MMVWMNSPSPPRIHVVATLLATVATLVARAWLQIQLVADGMPRLQASDLSYIATFPIFVFLVLPLVRTDRQFVAQQFRATGISLQAFLAAIVIGLLFRVAWWSQLVARISFGLISGDGGITNAGVSFSYQCPSISIIGLGILVSAVLIPVIEEVVHRGYVQSFLTSRGPVVAIVLSSIIFTSFHRFEDWGFAFAAGTILGTMYWLSGSLWAPVITHAVINFTPQLTWRCMSLKWNPSADSLPLTGPGMVSLTVFAVATTGMGLLVFTQYKRRDT
jgi:membrane protease YdiL (CAAX protease family)